MGGGTSTPEPPPPPPPDPSASDTPTQTPTQTPTASITPSPSFCATDTPPPSFIRVQEGGMFTLPTRWYCYPETSLVQIIRRNINRDIECYSLNGKDCAGAYSTENCYSWINYEGSVIPLSCGQNHAYWYGSTGYDTLNHWCQRGHTLLPDYSPSSTQTSQTTPSASSSSSASPSASSSASSAPSQTPSPSSTDSVSISSSASSSSSPSTTSSPSHTQSHSVSATSSMSKSAEGSQTSSPSARPTEHARGPPPPLPNDIETASPELIEAYLEDFSHYDPLLVKDSLVTLASLGFQQSSGLPFVVSTPAFVIHMAPAPTANTTTVTVGSMNIELPPLQTLYPNAVATNAIVWKSNPYESNDTNVPTPDSPTFSLELLDASFQPIAVHNLETPILLEWKLNISESDPRFLEPPFYFARCDLNQVYLETSSQYERFEDGRQLAKGAWELPCLLDTWWPLNCTSFAPYHIESLKCPPPIFTPKCMYWSHVNQTWQDEGCVSIHANKTHMTCACTHLTDFSSRIQAIGQTNQQLFANAANVYSLDGLQRYAQWYGVFGGIAVATLLLTCLVSRSDRKATKRFVRALCEDPTIQKTLKQSPNVPLYVYDSNSTFLYSSQTKPIGSLEEPNQQTSKTILQRIAMQHSRLQTLFRFDPRLARIFRVLFLFILQFHSLFVTALLYGFTYGDKTSMELSETIALAAITSALNIPVVKVLVGSLNTIGSLEFKAQYERLYAEYTRRLTFEAMAIEYIQQEKQEQEKASSESTTNSTEALGLVADDEEGVLDAICIRVCCKRAKKTPKTVPPKTCKQQMDAMVQLLQTPLQTPQVHSTFWSYAPCHTWQGAVLLGVGFGWFGWCLNYLLLFASAQEPHVGESILTSYATSELTTLFVQQPLIIALTYGAFYLLSKYKHKLPNRIKEIVLKDSVQSIPALFYFSNPWQSESKSSFTAEFTYAIFTRCAALASGVIPEAYAPVKAIAPGLASHSRSTSSEDEVNRLYAQCMAIVQKKELSRRPSMV